MDLFIHDIAVAIQRDAASPPAGRWAWQVARLPASANAASEPSASSEDRSADQFAPGVTR
jgi:hypothetical protein